MHIPILFSNENFIVVDKPPGVSVHRNHFFPDETPVLQRLRDQINREVWPVHRLDRQTSGCLIFALQKKEIQGLSEKLQHGKEQYWAFVRGNFPHKERVRVNTPIANKRGKLQTAISFVTCMARSVQPRCSLLLVEPQTGRNHQVRRHVRDLHHPILHDGDHGDARVNRFWRENHNLNRLALHAGVIELPFGTKYLRVYCSLPSDLFEVFKTMPWWADVSDTVFSASEYEWIEEQSKH